MAKSSKISYFPTLIIIAIASFAFTTSGGDWTLKKDKDGIKIYTRSVADSQLKEYKAITLVKTDINSAKTLILDFASYPEWQHNCSTAKLVKKSSDHELYSYVITDAPWPVSDREVVVRTDISEQNGVITMKMTAIDDLVGKSKSMVRIPAMTGFWQLTDKGNGTVEIMQQVHADPGGSIPDWLANSAVVDTPFKTLLNMKKRLER